MKASVLPFIADPGQLEAKVLGFIQLQSEQLNLPTCSLPGYRFSAHVGFPLISWQVHTRPGPFSGREAGVRLEVRRCTVSMQPLLQALLAK